VETSRLSARAGLLKPSPTLGITAKANALKAEGHDVISFAAGEPDFNTPAPICEAAAAALHAGFTKYTPSAGIKELREAIAEKLRRENGLAYEPGQVVVSCGAKHAVYNALQVLVDPGDEVILIAPYWMTYADQVALAGARPVVVHARAEDDFVPDPDALRAAVTPRTRAIIVNSPGNPTGAVFPRATLKAIGALALRHGLWILSDEIYEHLIYEGEHQPVAALGQDVYERTITIGGCSKSFAMTGWRIGYAAAPSHVAAALSNFQDQVTSNPTSFAQKGAIAAYGLGERAVLEMREEFRARRDLMVGLLEEVPGVEVRRPKGAFYVFPRFASYFGGKVADDAELATHILETARVAVVPGSVFEGPGHLRLSYAASRNDIERGVERLRDCLRELAR
jgi:aspartate aminotransferase